MKTIILMHRENSVDEIQTVDLDVLPSCGAKIQVNDPKDGYTDAIVEEIAWDCVAEPPRVEITVRKK